MEDNLSVIQSNVKALDEGLPQVLSLYLKGGEIQQRNYNKGLKLWENIKRSILFCLEKRTIILEMLTML